MRSLQLRSMMSYAAWWVGVRVCCDFESCVMVLGAVPVSSVQCFAGQYESG